ncbi:MAG TPA: hypothetical protein VIV12_07770 [Streptosporangiaceae bacterium]
MRRVRAAGVTDSRGKDWMPLLQKQQLFVELLSHLIRFVYEHPTWRLTLGEGYRSDGQGHMPGSLHYVRLAQDFNLFVEGVYVRGHHPAWDEIGATWKGLHPLARWGGDFMSRDWNHFSIAHEGKA